MLPLESFLPAVRAAIPRFRPSAGRGPAPNDEQAACILHPPALPLQIVAGPGSGKTTVLVLRALRHVLVDGLLPEQVLLTTFTKKAAEEIRTRLIEWGQQLRDHLLPRSSGALLAFLDQIDVNRFLTGTLDSICEEALRDARSATDPAPALLEGFAADTILLRRGLTGTVYKEAQLESVASFVNRLRGSRLGHFTDRVRAIMVDEPQETNRLQESIHFKLYPRAVGLTFTVVCDDEQSFFRGTTIEVFCDSDARLRTVDPHSQPQRHALVSSYRPTPQIVSFPKFVESAS